MGVTDETKPSDSSKQKPPLLPKPALSSIRNEAAESSVPQMVITSAEEVAEELKLAEEKESAEVVKSDIGQAPVEETVVAPSAFHRPLVISGPEVSTEIGALSKEIEEQRISESPPKSAVQRPLVVDDPESLHEASKDVQARTSESPPQSAIQRPLVFDLGPAAVLVEGEVREEKKEREEVQSASQRPLVIKTDGSQQDGISSGASSRVPVSYIDGTRLLATSEIYEDGTTDTELQITQTQPVEKIEVNFQESKADSAKTEESSGKPEGSSLFTFLKHGRGSKGDKSLPQHKELLNEQKDSSCEHYTATEAGSSDCKHKELPKEQRDLKKEIKEFFNLGHTVKEDKSVVQQRELNEQKDFTKEHHTVTEAESSECKHKDLPKEHRDLKKEIKEFFTLGQTTKDEKSVAQQKESPNEQKDFSKVHYTVIDAEHSEYKPKELPKEQRDLKKEFKEFFSVGHAAKENKSVAQQKELLNVQKDSTDEYYTVSEAETSECKPKELPKEQRDLKKEFKDFFSVGHAAKEDKSVAQQKEPLNVKKDCTDEDYTVAEAEISECKPKELPKEQRDLKKEFKEFFSLGHTAKEDKSAAQQKELLNVQKDRTDEDYTVTEAETSECKPKELPKEQRDLKKEFKEFFSLGHAAKEDKSVAQQKESLNVQKDHTDKDYTVTEAETSECKPKELPKEQRDLKKEFKEFFSLGHAAKEDKSVAQQKELLNVQKDSTDEYYTVSEAEISECKPKELPKEQRDLKKEFKEFFSVGHAVKEDKSVAQQKESLNVQKDRTDEDYSVTEAETSECKPKELPKEQRDLKKEFKEFFSLGHAAKEDKSVAQQKELLIVQKDSTDEYYTVSEAETSECKPKELPKEQRDLKKEFKEFFSVGHAAKEDKSVAQQKEPLNVKKDCTDEDYTVAEAEISECKPKELPKEQRDLKKEFKEFFSLGHTAKEDKSAAQQKEPLSVQKDSADENFRVTKAECSEFKPEELPKEHKYLKKEFKDFFSLGHTTKDKPVRQQKESLDEKQELEDSAKEIPKEPKDLKTEFKEFFKRQKDSKIEFSEEQKSTKETKPSVVRKESVKIKESLKEQKDVVKEKNFPKEQTDFENSRDSKEQKSDAEELHPPKETKENASEPESLYETCCIRLAVLIRNKAIDIVSSKTGPPTKPPKPSAETIAKARAAAVAKRVQEYENRPRSFGDDIRGGYDGLRYVDDDTESSTDYKDVEEDMVFIMDPQYYGIMDRGKNESKLDTFSVPSTCSGMTSYYTADAGTLKDENMSDNTLDTVSLGSEDSWVASKPLSLTGIKKESSPLIVRKDKLKTSSGLTERQVPRKEKPLVPEKPKATPEIKSSVFYGEQQTVFKRVPPPVPPKPAVLLKSNKNTASKIFPEASQSEVAKCVNSLSLSPRPSSRVSTGSRGTRKRPLTIAGIKEIEFPISLINKTPDIQRKTVLTTVVKNQHLKTISPLPSVPSDSQKPLPSCLPSSVQTDLPLLQTSKKSPPQRPPPPNFVKQDVMKSESVVSESTITSSLIYQSEDKDLPPSKPVHKSRPHVSPPRPPPPSIKGVVRPPRPPPPVRPTSKNLEGVVDLSTTVSPESWTKVDDTSENVENLSSSISQNDSFLTPAEVSLSKLDDNLVTENNLRDADEISEISSHSQAATQGTDSISRPLKFPTEVNETTSEVKLQLEAITPIAQSEQGAPIQEENKFADNNVFQESKLEIAAPTLGDTISSDLTILSSLPDTSDTISKSTVEPASDVLSKTTVNACDSTQNNVEPQPPPRSCHKKPRPPPRIRRNRSRTVEVVPLTWKPEERRRRSQSLSEMDSKKKSTEQQQLSSDIKPELKVLYTAVSKDPGRNKTKIEITEIEYREKTPEKISSRPLPAPPPPPRSRSKSSSTSRKPANDIPSAVVAKEELCPSAEPDKLDADKEIDKMQSEKLPDNKQSIKPIARKRKEERYRFRSLDSGCKTSIPLSSESISEINKTIVKIPENAILPIKPERKAKIQHREIQYDENANVAEPVQTDINIKTENLSQDHTKAIKTESHFSSDRKRIMHSVSCSDYDNKALSERETESPSRSQRAKSASPEQKSRSSWYDESDVSGDLGDVDTSPSSQKESLEKLNCLPMGIEKSAEDDQQKSRHGKGKSDSLKKPRETSKFYVDVCEQGTDPQVLPGKEDKETSPLPLECSEKSVQTSLETLSHGIQSRSEQSDDTDELLDLAQTLQDELKIIISRHKKFGEEYKSEGEISNESNLPSSHTIITQSKLSPSLSEKKSGKKVPSARSSTSELWQMTSSEESEDEFIDQQEMRTPEEAAYARKKKKVFYIAREIMTSEEVFVDALKLLNVDFKQAVEKANEEKGAPIVPDEVLNQILNHLPQLQRLNENLLMDLKDRIQRWDEVGKIADVIVKIGPFLKLYSWYIQDFESTTTLLEESQRKYPMFCQFIKEFEMSPRCKRLALNHYMLKPVQRIPQYRLLLQEYLHHLPENSPDYQDTQTALQIVTEVASHANESMKQGDNFQKLILIQSSILGHREIIKPGRLFIKEGELMKLSRKGMQPRWFVLLNDLLLYLTSVQQGLYRVNHELSLTGMKVAIPVQQDYQNEFSIISVTRSFTLAAKSQEERQEWIIALTKAIEENASKRSTFTSVRLQQKAQERADDENEEIFVLGKKAPVWIPDSRVTMCQLCTSEFTVTFRRHHCRACGKVICSICSSNRTALHYLGNRIARVCEECFLKLEQGSGGYTESGETDSDNQQIAVKSHLRTDNKHSKKGKRHMPSVLKEVCANDQGSSISGYLQKKSGKGWRKNWFVVKDKVLYEYRASEDVAALRSVPLLGYMIETFSESLEGVDPGLLFQLTHPGQAAIVFHAETLGSTERWIQALKEATVLE